jgi:hypothetical protein
MPNDPVMPSVGPTRQISATPKSAGVGVLIISLAILTVWFFPKNWYNQYDARANRFWLTAQTNIAGWQYTPIPIDKSAEKVLVADALTNGEYKNPQGAMIRVFLAKRYVENNDEIGLFVHTPDRCWTEAGWHIEPASAEFAEVPVAGLQMPMERRVFTTASQRELVYFGGLVGGQPLPYRLDHNLSVGMKHQLRQNLDKTGSSLRAGDKRLWTRVWDAFKSRRPLLGPKEFIRVSIPVKDGNLEAADRLLQEFMGRWLQPVDYQDELNRWKTVKS